MGDLWLFLEQPCLFAGDMVDRVNRVHVLAALDGSDVSASLDGSDVNASLDGQVGR